jgi:hypothetical protein
LCSLEAAEWFVSIRVADGAKDRDHGWYPEGQKASEALLAKVLN